MTTLKTPIKWAELHSPLFLSGTNLGQKLDPTKRTGLLLEFDEDKRHLYVTWNKETGRVPEPSILSMIEGSVAPRIAHVLPVQKPVEAQAETPQDHVFAGPGKGKTK